MHTTWPELLAKLQADADYVTRFNTAYAGGLTRANVVDALASLERSLLTPHTRFDRYLRGERHALTAPEQQGYRLFKSYGCVACHQGRNIGGNMYLTYAGQALDTRVKVEPAVAAEITALLHTLLRFIHTPERSVGKRSRQCSSAWHIRPAFRRTSTC